MRFYTFNDDGREVCALAFASSPDSLYTFESLGLPFADLNSLIAAGSGALSGVERRAKEARALPLSGVSLVAPIPRPLQDMICMGMNYTEHAKESARFKNESFGLEKPVSVYFSKRVTLASPPVGIIPAYEGLVDSLDYECELAVILGRDAKNVSAKDAARYVFGYTIINDVSARNLQTGHKQWYFGKSLDGFTPMGPCVVTADEFSFPPELAIRSFVNGEPRQNSNTGLLIHSIAEIIEELSSGMTLRAGTIIATGTPAGVGMGFVPPNFLKSGDTIICEIDGIGQITSTVK